MIRKIYFLIFLFAFVCADNAFAGEDHLPLIAEGKYFTVFGYKGIDVDALAVKLNFDYFLHPDNLWDEAAGDSRNALAKSIDAILLEASDVLDIRTNNYQGKIKIVASQKDVNKIFKKKYGRNFSERAVYFLDEKTIYISGEDITLGMLGHEIANALISHHFIVPPPVKTQEILCGYVEYVLNKKISAFTPEKDFNK